MVVGFTCVGIIKTSYITCQKYYKYIDITSSVACRSPKARVTTHSRATLLWSPPYPSQMDLEPIWYTVHCEEPQNACQGLQGIRTNDTQVTVENLRDSTHFKWKICSENSVSRFVASQSNCASVGFETLKISKEANNFAQTCPQSLEILTLKQGQTLLEKINIFTRCKTD